jgi:hypothetical protein
MQCFLSLEEDGIAYSVAHCSTTPKHLPWGKGNYLNCLYVLFNNALCIALELSNIHLHKTANGGEKTLATMKIMKNILNKNNKYFYV